MTQQALRTFARAHLEIEKEKQAAADQMRNRIQQKSDLKKQILGELQDKGQNILQTNAQQFVRLKYNRSSRVVTFKIVQDVVTGFDDYENITSLQQFVKVISDRIHQLRVVKNATFEVLQKPPKALAAGGIPSAHTLNDALKNYELLTQQIKETRASLAAKTSDLRQIISRSTEDVAEYMRAEKTDTNSSNNTVRLDISQRGTYYIRQKEIRKPSRPQTVQQINKMTAKTLIEDLHATQENFKTLFLQNQSFFADRLFHNLKHDRLDTKTGLVRFSLDKTTKHK